MSDLRIATRRSPLALVQAHRVAHLLAAANPGVSIEMVEVSTAGDRDRVSPIAELTELGAFVRSVQDAVIERRADLAVHSLKDLPVVSPEALTLAAIPERASPFDVLVGRRLDALGPGALVGTGSPRRVNQLIELRPDLRTIELRGNVDTRLEKVAAGEVDATILAEAGLDRLGSSGSIAQRLDVSEMVPAPGQGALAIETRAGDGLTEMVAAIDDSSLRTLVMAERLLLAETGAGCRSALGALAAWEGNLIRMDAYVSDERGPRRALSRGETPEAVVAECRKALDL
ncbi:MAG TPA: hydroxymethylbilane synthase [Acidimicrobiia bacterium]|nr:hydroxymethylbilane synthase [Acidimicrobiia bacterium]